MRLHGWRWALLTATLYGLTVALLSVPLLLAALSDPERYDMDIQEFAQVYTLWQYWAAIGVLALLEAGLLLVPVKLARHIPVARGSWRLLAAVAGLMMGLLVAGLSFAVWEAVTLNTHDASLWVALGLGAAAWVWWAIVFARYAFASRTAAAYRKLLDRLIAGSIAELLVAVPCHVYVRHQDKCCAGFGTFLGLATGLCVLTFAFGPGVFFLFLARARRLRWREQDAETDAAPPQLNWLGRRVRHARQALLWGLGAVMFLTALLVAGAAGGQNVHELLDASRVSFVIIGSVACFHAVRSWLRREPGWRVAAVGAVLLAEVVLVAALWGWTR